MTGLGLKSITCGVKVQNFWMALVLPCLLRVTTCFLGWKLNPGPQKVHLKTKKGGVSSKLHCQVTKLKESCHHNKNFSYLLFGDLASELPDPRGCDIRGLSSLLSLRSPWKGVTSECVWQRHALKRWAGWKKDQKLHFGPGIEIYVTEGRIRQCSVFDPLSLFQSDSTATWFRSVHSFA